MEESRIRTIILEEIQGILNQISDENIDGWSPAAAVRSIGEIIAKRLDGVIAEKDSGVEKDQDTEIGKDSV